MLGPIDVEALAGRERSGGAAWTSTTRSGGGQPSSRGRRVQSRLGGLPCPPNAPQYKVPIHLAPRRAG
jgi:hypothetical protein